METMLACSERNCFSSVFKGIPSSMNLTAQSIDILEDRCQQAGIKMTDVRRALLFGILESGANSTANDIWKTLKFLTENRRCPSQASVQRTLNLMVDRLILRRDVTPDRLWRYSIMPESQESFSIIFVNIETGQKISCNAPEVKIILRRFTIEHGLKIQSVTFLVKYRERS